MSSATSASVPSKRRARRRPIKFAMIAAALGVVACFGAAASFSGDPAVAAEAKEAR